MILGKYKKQPNEVLDYDISYDDFFANRTDTIFSVVVTAQAGLTVVSTVRNGLTVKTILSGGADGTSYKVTVTLTTTTGIVKEDEFYVAVKEI